MKFNLLGITYLILGILILPSWARQLLLGSFCVFVGLLLIGVLKIK